MTLGHRFASIDNDFLGHDNSAVEASRHLDIDHECQVAPTPSKGKNTRGRITSQEFGCYLNECNILCSCVW
jgi:hypothetical protein